MNGPAGVTAPAPAAPPPATADGIRAAIAADPDGIVEALAARAGASPRDILEALPEGSVRLAPAAAFAAVWDEMTRWGDVLLIVHTPDIVLEVTGPLVAGSEGRGYFNVHGDSPIGGHIALSRCAAIAAVDRPFHGRRSCSVWFLNGDGAAMFKVFVRRGADRELDAAQLLRFLDLRERLALLP